MGFFVLLILFLLVFAFIPAWPYSRRWGYRPSGALGLLLLVWIILLFLVEIPWWGWNYGTYY